MKVIGVRLLVAVCLLIQGTVAQIDPHFSGGDDDLDDYMDDEGEDELTTQAKTADEKVQLGTELSLIDFIKDPQIVFDAKPFDVAQMSVNKVVYITYCGS